MKNGQCIRALLLWASKGVYNVSHFSVQIQFVYDMGKTHVYKWQVFSRLAFVCPYPNRLLFQWHFKAHLICWWHVLSVKQVLKSSRKLTWQTVDKALVSPKSHGSGWSCFNLYINKGLWFYMCRGAFFTVLCNTLITEKRNCFCRKGWRFEDFSAFVFVPSSKGPVAVFRWS